MTKFLFLLFLLFLVHASYGWTDTRLFGGVQGSIQLMAHSPQKQPASIKQDVDNPCWQDIYDEDCGMDSIYAASFIASEWVKSMPCGQGIEDCDMPEDLKLPGNRHTDGYEEVDVLDFLNLKRAPSIKKGKDPDISP